MPGRLLVSPYSAFRGTFPMNGTFFFQLELFEDESAGSVTIEKEKLSQGDLGHLLA